MSIAEVPKRLSRLLFSEPLSELERRRRRRSVRRKTVAHKRQPYKHTGRGKTRRVI